MSQQESLAFEAYLNSDIEAQKELNGLKEDIALLDKGQLSPSAELINDLLNRLQISHSEEAAY